MAGGGRGRQNKRRMPGVLDIFEDRQKRSLLKHVKKKNASQITP
jgi:hypothetical protein